MKAVIASSADEKRAGAGVEAMALKGVVCCAGVSRVFVGVAGSRLQTAEKNAIAVHFYQSRARLEMHAIVTGNVLAGEVIHI